MVTFRPLWISWKPWTVYFKKTEWCDIEQSLRKQVIRLLGFVLFLATPRGMWGLVPCPGIEPVCPEVGSEQSWTTALPGRSLYFLNCILSKSGRQIMNRDCMAAPLWLVKENILCPLPGIIIEWGEFVRAGRTSVKPEETHFPSPFRNSFSSQWGHRWNHSHQNLHFSLALLSVHVTNLTLAQ